MNRMVSHKNITFLLLPVLLLVFSLSGCGKPVKTIQDGQKPEITALLPTIKNIDLFGVELEFSMEVMNPYPLNAPNAQFTYSLEIMGKEFVTGKTGETINLKASQNNSVTFPVRIEFQKVSSVLENFPEAKKASYLLKGSLQFPLKDEIMEIPVTKEGEFPIFHMPEFHNVEIDSTDPSLFNIAITVKADLKNTNGFELGVHGLRYALSLGDMTVGELKVDTGRTIGAGKVGKITIYGKISAAGAVMNILNGQEVGLPKLEASGKIETPYGIIQIKPPEPTKD